ncbi:phospholipase B-like, partial [Haematococcus lacustris]
MDMVHDASGMGHLTINTSAVFPDSEQLKAAGFLEGWLTAERIHQHFQNMVAFYETSNNENGPAQFQFLATQEVWLRHQMNSSDTQQSPFWAYIRLLMAQFDGLVQPLHRTTSLAAASLPQRGPAARLASSAAGAEQPGAAGEEQPEAGEEEPLPLLSRVPHLTSAQLYFLCSLGDLGDITAALNRRQAMASQAASRQQGRQQAGGQQHGQQGQQ